MIEKEEKSNPWVIFWTTLPEILKGFAAVIVAIGGIGGIIVVTSYYKPYEHPFLHEDRIINMKQEEGDKYCKSRFDQLKPTVEIGWRGTKFDPNDVKHIWAHIENRDCVANTQ